MRTPKVDQIRKFLFITTDLVAIALAHGELPEPDEDFISVRKWLDSIVDTMEAQ